MFAIYKPSKILLYKKIKESSSFVNGMVLDAGSSNIKRYNHLFKNIKKIDTLDLNPDYKPDIIASIENIPVSDGSYDSIVCFQVLGDVFNLKKAVDEFYRILKKGGTIMISKSFFNELHGKPFDYWRFTNFGLEKLFVQAGFKIVRLEQIGGFFSVLAQIIIRYLIDKFDLFNKKFWNYVFALPIKILGTILVKLDNVDKGKANKNFAIGWLIVAKK